MRRIIFGLFALFAGTLVAATVRVSDTALTTLANGDEVEAYTAVKLDGFPTEIGLPEIWFDASDRNCAGAEWEYDATDATKVTKIPSKSKNGRYLTISTSEGGHWSGFSVNSPRLVSNVEDLVPGCALDFGSQGSKQAFVFNPDTTGSNCLNNIGTILAVIDTSNWGGYLLGGGHDAGKRDGYIWNRGINVKKTGNGEYAYDYTDPVFHQNQVIAEFKNAIASQNGALSSPYLTGFSGKWEVLSITPTAASGCAYGIGLGDSRPAVSGRDSGGQRIAEMLIFTKVLTAAERQKAELYLNRKWFGTPTYGQDGEARLGTVRASVNNANQETGCASFDVMVPADEHLTLDRVLGGRGAATPSLVKKGPGTLVLNGAENYGGTVSLMGGTLAFERRSVPADVPFGYCARFDASAAGAIETEGDEITRWRNEASVPTKDVVPVAAVSKDDAHRPTLIRDCFGPGMHAVDFGKYQDGGWMSLVSDAGAYVEFPNVHTVIAVVGARNGGGYYLVGAEGLQPADNVFRRGVNLSDNAPSWSTAIVRDGAIGSEIVPARVYLNGRKSEPSAGYVTPGWQTVAIQTSGSKFGSIANTGGNANYHGGMQIAEIIVYYRPLSEREMLDAEAYLSSKWLKCATPGYERPAGDETPEIRAVTVTGPAEINVPEGVTVRIGTLDVQADLVKTGAGRLEVLNVSKRRRFTFDIREGDVYVVDPPDPVTTSEVATGAAVHLDATDESSFSIVPESDLDKVAVWKDVSGESAAYMETAGRRPWREATGPNGLSAVNFGEYGDTTGKYLVFDRPHDGVRSAFAVVKFGTGGGTALGAYQTVLDTERPLFMDFMHENGQTNLLQQSVPTMVRDGELRIDGEAVTWKAGIPDGYALIEYHPTAAAHVSALGVDRGLASRSGGFTIGEVLLYERELTTREKEATRNALMTKWFGTAPKPLSEKPASKAGKYVPNNPGGLVLIVR